MWSEYLRMIDASFQRDRKSSWPSRRCSVDLGAAGGALDGLDRVLALAGRLPAHALRGGAARPPGDERHPVGDDERRVEADAELADEPRVLCRVAGERGEELAGARLGDGADVGDHLVVRHADAVVADRDRARVLVERDADRELGVVLVAIGMGQRLEAQLVGGVRGVGDELAQEDLRVAVQRVDHELQELLHLRLESEGLATRRGCGPAVLAVDFRHFDFLQLVERAGRGGAPGATDRGSGISLPGGVILPRRRSAAGVRAIALTGTPPECAMAAF